MNIKDFKIVKEKYNDGSNAIILKNDNEEHVISVNIDCLPITTTSVAIDINNYPSILQDFENAGIEYVKYMEYPSGYVMYPIIDLK